MAITFKDIYIMAQNKVQPHLKSLYNRACEILPPSLIMSDKYFEAKSYLELEEINDESNTTVTSIQRKLVARTLKNALENVPYYKKRVNIDPKSINEDNAFEILNQFPVIDKQEIMNNPTEFISKNLNKYLLIYTTSGGSTGRGISLWKKYDEYQTEEAFVEEMWSKFGYSRKSKVLRMGAEAIAPLNKPPCQQKDRRLLVSPRHLNERWLPEIVEKIDEFQPDFIHSYPSCLEVLASHLKRESRGLSIKGIFLASEEIKPEQLDFFNEVFGVPIHFFYGASEHVLQGIGCYDGKNVCYHLNPLYGFAENLKDDYGYELVGTGLWNEAMPLIRYKTQDYGEIEEELTKCEVCGRAWKTVRQLDGRKQNYLTTKQGTKFPGISIWVDKFIWDYVSSFQFVQNRPGEMELHVIPRSNFTPEVEERILEAQRKRLAEWFDPITLVKQSEIAITNSGKRRLVVVNSKANTDAVLNHG